MTSLLFDGIDTTWSRIPNSEPVTAEIRQIISKFNPADPVASVPDLLKLRQAMSRIQDDSWIPEITAELQEIIAACIGLHVIAASAKGTYTPWQPAPTNHEAT